MDLLKLVEYYTTKLNANSNGIVFVGHYLIQTSDDEYEYVIHPESWIDQTVKYVPVRFDFVGDSEVAPTQNIVNWNLLVGMDLEGDYDEDPELTKQINSVYEFITGLETNPLDTIDTYRIATKTNPVSKEEHVTRSGGKRISIALELDVTTGIGIYFGNDITYQLALTGQTLNTITLLSATTINGATATTEADLTENNAITKTTNADGTVTYDVSLIYTNSNLDNELVKSLNGINSVNTKYDYTETWPTFSISKTLVVQGGTITKNINDIVIINVRFTEST